MSPIFGYETIFVSSVNISKISMGAEHILVLDGKLFIIIIIIIANGNLFSAGDNTYGEVGINELRLQEKVQKITFFNNLNNKVEKITTGIRSSMVLLSDGSIYAFGDNSEGQLTGLATRYTEPTHVTIEDDIKERVIDLHAGYNHVIILTNKGSLYSFGSTAHGKLGYNELKQSNNFPKVIQNLKERNINYIHAGKNFTVISTISKK